MDAVHKQRGNGTGRNAGKHGGFTLLELQRTVEAISGIRLHKQNFRRLMAEQGLVEGTGKFSAPARGRPAELFRFRREVLRERPAPGVRLSSRR